VRSKRGRHPSRNFVRNGVVISTARRSLSLIFLKDVSKAPLGQFSRRSGRIDLKGHPKTHRVYAWMHDTGDPAKPSDKLPCSISRPSYRHKLLSRRPLCRSSKNVAKQTKPKKMGRPKLASGEAKGRILHVRFRAENLKAIPLLPNGMVRPFPNGSGARCIPQSKPEPIKLGHYLTFRRKRGNEIFEPTLAAFQFRDSQKQQLGNYLSQYMTLRTWNEHSAPRTMVGLQFGGFSSIQGSTSFPG
jgi:hypothetical protein